MDQHLTLSRVEAICPPSARRPHRQDAYLAARAPESPMSVLEGDDHAWRVWIVKSDLMRRLIAKFRLDFSNQGFEGPPRLPYDYVVPSFDDDRFGRELGNKLLPVVHELAGQLK